MKRLKKPVMLSSHCSPSGKLWEYSFNNKVSIKELARRGNISPNTLQSFVQRHTSATPLIVKAVAKATKTKPSYWTNIQKGYDNAANKVLDEVKKAIESKGSAYVVEGNMWFKRDVSEYMRSMGFNVKCYSNLPDSSELTVVVKK